MYVWVMLFCIVSYLLGSIPTGLILVSMFTHQDIRTLGSGNIGATNVTRILGIQYGIITFVGDVLKGFLAVYIGTFIFEPLLPVTELRTAVCFFGLTVFLGHLFSAYLKGKGGKGVATAFGIFLYLEPMAAGIVLVMFIIVVCLWRYVSLGSLTAAAAMPFVLVALCFFKPVVIQNIVLGIVAGLMIIVKHKSNIQKLLQGTENKIRAAG